MEEAKVLGSIDITAAGGGKCLLGDLDGDGRMELVVVQADSDIDDRYVPHQITCVTAYRLTGEMLWQTGECHEKCGSFGADFPAQVYDIDADGKEIWRYDGSIESQHIALGKFCPELPRLQVAGLDRIRRGDGYKGQWDGKDGMFLLDCNGHELWKEDRKTKGWLTIVDALYGWNGENRDYILAYRRGGGELPALYDGHMQKVVTFPHDGYVVHADLFGRGKEDVIVYDKNTAWICSGTPYDLSQTPSDKPIFQTKRLYSSTLYPGGVCTRKTDSEK